CLCGGDDGAGLQNVGDDAAVGDHHAFGQASRAAGVGQSDHVVCIVETHLGDLAVALQQRGKGRRAGGLAQHEDLLHAGAPCRLDCLVQKCARGDIRDGDQELGTGVVELEGKLVNSVERIDGGDGAAEHRDGQDGDGVFGQIGAVDSEDVTLGEAALGKACCDESSPHGKLTVGESASTGGVNQRRLLGQLASALEHDGVQGDVGYGDVCVRAAEDHACLLFLAL